MSPWRTYVADKTTESWMASSIGRYFIIGLALLLLLIFIKHIFSGDVPSRAEATVALDEYFRSDGKDQMAAMRSEIRTSISQGGGIDKFSFYKNVRIVSSNFSPRHRFSISAAKGSVVIAISEGKDKGEFLIDFLWHFRKDDHGAKMIGISDVSWTHANSSHAANH